MHAALFRSAARWSAPGSSRTVFLQLADSLGLQGSVLASCVDEPRIEGALAGDRALGGASGVVAVPAIFLDGQPLEPRSPDALMRRVAREIRR